MQITHDPRANVAYIRLRDRQGTVETLRITSDFLPDIDKTGAVCGIELLNANERLVVTGAGSVGSANPVDRKDDGVVGSVHRRIGLWSPILTNDLEEW